MIKKTLKVELFQSSEQAPTFNQFENELGAITNSVRSQKGKYILTIPNAFVGFLNFFCPQNKSLFNCVGGENTNFNLNVQIISDSEIELNTFDENMNYWEDSLVYIPLQLDVYFPDAPLNVTDNE